jgi:hypothetical protein
METVCSEMLAFEPSWTHIVGEMFSTFIRRKSLSSSMLSLQFGPSALEVQCSW